ncbi:hypothetical protein GOP47_0020216 [Adiantum capillus-veneris]|uniref:ATP synthase subunit b', chloroplastic n=1 Tax=Adiantum capillus-veneris TaxID=13818 RepID=A0A9D4UE42_ADICA|nr:hypothetical protein GOP47_0020216 [Adiantum capillus-veneris]
MEGVVSVRAATPTALCVATTPSPASSSRSLSYRLPAIRGSLKHQGCNTSSSSSLQESLQRMATKITQNPTLRNAAFFAMNALWAVPAIAAEVAAEAEEKGKIFDFNLTLPIIAAEFLLLMVTLDNIWFKPVAKVMDDRDEAIRQKLMSVRDNSDEIKKLQEQAEAILKAARAETTAELNKMKRETAAKLDAKLQESRERIEKELAEAIANLEVQKQETLKSLDKEVQDLSEEIIAKVIPFKI